MFKRTLVRISSFNLYNYILVNLYIFLHVSCLQANVQPMIILGLNFHHFLLLFDGYSQPCLFHILISILITIPFIGRMKINSGLILVWFNNFVESEIYSQNLRLVCHLCLCSTSVLTKQPLPVELLLLLAEHSQPFSGTTPSNPTAPSLSYIQSMEIQSCR